MPLQTLNHLNMIAFIIFFCLKWLNDGSFHMTREVESGLGKSANMHLDLVQVLTAIIEGLDGQIQ